MTAFNDRNVMLGALVRALPYIQRYRGKAFVLQVEGAFCADRSAQRQLADQVSVLRGFGIQVVLVHGPGPQLGFLSERLNVGGRFVDGHPVTDDVALDLQTMACAGMINVEMISAFRGAGVPTVGITGIDAGLIKARQRAPLLNGALRPDQDLVGEVIDVDPKVLETLMSADGAFVPLICPLSADEHGIVLSLDADSASAAIAVAMKAEKLIFLTELRGLPSDPANPDGEIVSYIDLAGLESMRVRGALDLRMQSKARAAARALHGGVQRVHLVGHQPDGSLLAEIFTNEGTGTLIVEDAARA
ncbi:MAG: acetylglutamate kinase [Myxococcales bacterium]|jgi:acetylglutamate kinase|nr:acetylglutamate kinase [Myxococcales bacterium]